MDIFDSWMQRGENWRLKRLTPDGLHPNTLGYQSLLEDVIHWNAIAPYNSSNSYQLK